MRRQLLFLLLFVVGTAAAGEKWYESGELLEMEAVPCGYDQKGGKGLAGSIIGTDSEHRKTKEMLCPEYLLQSEKILYRIRPKDEKKPALLPIGEKAQFRIDKDKMKLRVPESGEMKERDYYVISMTRRSTPQAAKAAETASATK